MLIRLISCAVLVGGTLAGSHTALLRGGEEPELRVSGDGVDHVAKAHEAAQAMLTKSTEARATGKGLCAEEKAATKKWLSGGLGEDEDAKKARAASKAALHGALGNRIAGLTKFLAKLKKIRARLYDHIDRVNNIYGAKFQENMNYMQGAVSSLHALSVILTTPISPKLRPIKNFVAYEPPSDGAAAAAKAVEEVEQVEPTSFMFLEVGQQDAWDAQNMRFSTMKAENDECCSSHACPCSKGRQQAFELYEKSLALNQKMSVNFEAEREVLAAFRKGLKKMIDDREANLKALSEQLSKLEAAMNRKEEPIQGLFKKMEVHLDVLGSACKQQAENADLDVPQFEKLISLIKEHHVGETEVAAAGESASEAAVVQ